MARTEDTLRRLTILAALALIVESALYSAVAPLLPYYRDHIGLSKSAAGILTASYVAAMVVGSLVGAAAAGRIGPRRTVVAGFAVLAVSSFAFGLAGSIGTLDAARAAQGFGAGLIWSGMLAWLIAAAPEDRRGQVLGTALGAAIFGTLFGPVLGTVATAIGPLIAFAVIAASAAAMVPWVLRTPAPARDPDLRTDWRRALRSRLLVGLTVLCLLPGMILGAMNALIPLRLDAGGFSDALVGATFLVAALVAAAVAPSVGRRSDRSGRVPLIVVSLAITAPALIALGLVQDTWAIAVLTVATFGFAISVISVPAWALLSEVAEDVGVTAGPAAALINLTLAGGETLGAPISAVGAELTSDAVPFVVLGAIALAAMVAVARRVREPRAQAQAQAQAA